MVFEEEKNRNQLKKDTLSRKIYAYTSGGEGVGKASGFC